MLTGEVKKVLIDVVQKFVTGHQERRSKLTNEDVKKFLSTHQRKYTHQPQ
jgi:tryptophanyl-tRNA synthetase